MSNRKALSALNTHQSALRPTASLYSGKTNTKRSAAVQKNSARKVIGNDINNLDCDKLSIDDSIRTVTGDSCSSSDDFFDLSDISTHDHDVFLRPYQIASRTNTTHSNFEASANLKRPPVVRNIYTSVESGMDWTAHNIEFFCTIQPEFQYEVPDDIEDYDAEL